MPKGKPDKKPKKPKFKKIFSSLFILIGVLFLAGATWVALDNEARESNMRKTASHALQEIQTTETKENPQSLPTKEIDGNLYIGVLMIPSIGVELPILNVCTNETLDTAPGLFSGNPYYGNMVIGGHNAAAHLAGLNKLKTGDEVLFKDFNDMTWKYQVVKSEVLEPNMSEELTNSEYEMSLFNCTWDNSQRFVIRCHTPS